MSLLHGFRALNLTTLSSDDNVTSLAQLPANLLEVLIPGYSIISNFLLHVLGFDATLLVLIFALLFGLYTAVTFLWTHAYAQFEEYFTSLVYIDHDDDMYMQVMKWLQAQKAVKSSRKIIAKTSEKSVWELQEGDGGMEELIQDSQGLLNFSSWDAKVPPEFRPFYGTYHFFHKGRYFNFVRAVTPVLQHGWGGTHFHNEESITLRCIGRSTEPIKNLLRECRNQYAQKKLVSTVVHRPANKEARTREKYVWQTVATRPSRPLDTVVLDSIQKENLLNDINEYLHPSTARWYANRGIPYRRGYLFAGPPGTGKSSLAWAVSGVFGLGIFCISLVDPTLTEDELGTLFLHLPSRCVVLLEDIDSAGLIKRHESEDQDDEGSDAATAGVDKSGAQIGAEIAKALQSANKNERLKGKNNNEGISLSGLLNAIDGIASHEGRVLVMTTNFPNKLDDALIRPGRVDLRIDFTLATRHQTCELFTRMYSPDQPRQAAILSPTGAKSLGFMPTKAGIDTPPQTPRSNDAVKGLDNTKTENIASIAARFAEKVPENAFSPAEIQGFLLKRKKEPLRALNEVESWRDELLKAKAKKQQSSALEANKE